MKTNLLSAIFLLGFSLATFAAETNKGDGKDKSMPAYPIFATCAEADAAAKLAAAKSPPEPPVFNQECESLKKISGSTRLQQYDAKENTKASVDGKIRCVGKANFTFDYTPCESALAYYNSVVAAENAMNLEQKLRTQVKNQNIQNQANKQIASGDSQNGIFDAAIESNKHQKNMQQEKALIYGVAVGALAKAYTVIPTDKEALKKCMNNVSTQAVGEDCKTAINNNRSLVLGNQEAKAALAYAVMEFTAKGVAAGIAMGQYNNAAQQIAAAKAPLDSTAEDVMMERCTFNPQDPACVTTGTKGTGTTFSSGDFSVGTDGNSAFNMTPYTETPATTLDPDTDTNKPVAGVNSPFEAQAKIAKGIVDPAAAAQNGSPGGAAAGAGGGGGGSGGGGSSSLGSDLNGADKDGDKEAQIKTSKVNGNYNAAGGSGFKGVGGGKDDANPFSSLFDAKSAGGIEEDRSIASGDIDGASSGLFQKISKRYGQIQADKRIEAKNLE
jgi:hypothetical protein